MGPKSVPVSIEIVRQCAQLVVGNIGRGSFIHKTHADWDEKPCPFCGQFSYFAYLDDEWKGNQSSPDDVFECIGCGSTMTRRDAFGAYDDPKFWDKDRFAAKRKRVALRGARTPVARNGPKMAVFHVVPQM